MTEPQPSRLLRLRVAPAAERAVRAGHPWVYGDSIREQNREGQTGELGVIYDARDRFLAIGLFDADSPLRLRVLHAGKPVRLDLDWWRTRLQSAIERRRAWFDAETTGFRWIHGENDGWPGLVLDRYGDTLVLKLYTAAWLPLLTELTALIRDELAPQRLVFRVSRNAEVVARSTGLVDGHNLIGDSSDERVVFLENGLRFEAEVVRGQKTGFFLDQRENRQRLETFAAGADVLNVFSFSGGFSLYAARGGARSVTDLDISAHALAQARRNVALNQTHPRIAAARHEQVQADAFEWLAEAPPRQFDVVVLDPPSLAKREVERAEAIRAYERLAAHGLRWLRPGGLLLAASCSAHVSDGEFFQAVRGATRRSGRPFEEQMTTGHPSDHAATFAEAKYLKAIYLRFSRNSTR